MRFRELFDRAKVVPASLDGDADFRFLSADSRELRAGEVFVCMPSPNTDSHQYIDAAIEGGAAAIIVHAEEVFEALRGKIAVALIEPEKFDDASWRLSKIAFDDPSASLKVVGITGTNGKTTVAWLMRDMLDSLGVKAAYLGTLGFHLPGEARPLPNTTPFAVDVNRMLADAVERGIEVVAMEISSHALAQKRVDGIEFDAAVFTNLTQDHLDYHGDMAQYAAAKRRLFTELAPSSSKSFTAAINADDAEGSELVELLGDRAVSFGRQSGKLTFQEVEVGVDELTFQLSFRKSKKIVHAPLGGSFNVENSVAAIAGLLALGYSFDAAAESIRSVRPVPGRFESVKNSLDIGVIVDYAHTPDALQKLLESVRDLDPKGVITVFGCGGDRDKTKRPLMAKAVSSNSDLTIVTSDNPRTEDPQTILDEVLEGVLADAEAVAILDRKEAIGYAIRHADPGDVVVIAGKGHENYQIIGRTKHPMDDREMAREALEARR